MTSAQKLILMWYAMLVVVVLLFGVIALGGCANKEGVHKIGRIETKIIGDRPCPFHQEHPNFNRMLYGLMELCSQGDTDACSYLMEVE